MEEIKNPKIILIEDDTDIIEALKIILQAHNFTITSAIDPDNGLQKIKEDKPDLIILDVMFGSEHKTLGFDFCLKLKQDKSLAKIPVLMLTAINVEYPQFGFSDKTDNEYLPVDDFLNKPVKSDELVEKVKLLLNQKESKWSNWPEKNP
ncbi:MAG: response regulator [Candidatus Omnitrophica bacterium]|nr:response regulator [Candidatus Omnitrophota bacterium]